MQPSALSGQLSAFGYQLSGKSHQLSVFVSDFLAFHSSLITHYPSLITVMSNQLARSSSWIILPLFLSLFSILDCRLWTADCLFNHYSSHVTLHRFSTPDSRLAFQPNESYELLPAKHRLCVCGIPVFSLRWM